MRFTRRDTKEFALYRARYEADAHGDGVNVYDGLPVAEFRGNIQPVSEKISTEAYGLDLKYGYVVYTPSDVGFAETDRITDGEHWYEVKTIRRWNSYIRLLVEEVTVDG